MDLMDGITNYIISKQEGNFPGPKLVQPEVKLSDRMNRIDEIYAELDDDQKPLFMEQLRQQDKKYYTPEFVYEENYPKHNRSLFSDSYGDDDLAISSDNINLFDKELQEAGKLLSNPDMSDIFKSGVFSPYFEEIQEPLKLYYENFNRFPNTLEELVKNKQIDGNYY
jgi:hypothetical protein